MTPAPSEQSRPQPGAFCSACGTPVTAASSRFCGKCGSPVAGVAPQDQRLNRLRIALVAAAGTILVGLAATAVVILVGGGDATEDGPDFSDVADQLAGDPRTDPQPARDPESALQSPEPSRQPPVNDATADDTEPAAEHTSPQPASPEPTGGAGRLDGDLGLSTAMAAPPCDGSFVTILASAVEPDTYAQDVATWLDDHPGSDYLRTDVVGCTSLRQEVDGNAIYAVYFGPFPTQDRACDARPPGSAAYVKRLDNTSDPRMAVRC